MGGNFSYVFSPIFCAIPTRWVHRVADRGGPDSRGTVLPSREAPGPPIGVRPPFRVGEGVYEEGEIQDDERNGRGSPPDPLTSEACGPHGMDLIENGKVIIYNLRS